MTSPVPSMSCGSPPTQKWPSNPEMARFLLEILSKVPHLVGLTDIQRLDALGGNTMEIVGNLSTTSWEGYLFLID